MVFGRAFAGNKDVVFGDVNIRENRIDSEGVGAGGWPTVKYYNKETGLGGATYNKKTSMSMCDELGPEYSYMEEYVEEAGKTSLCSIADGSNCDERSLNFLEKQKTKDAETWKTQFERLEALEDGDMKADLKAWVKIRKKILRTLLAEAGQADAKAEL